MRDRLPHGAQAPAVAREAVDANLRGRLSDQQLLELRLLVSELVTNAVRHGAEREHGVELTVRVRGGVARVEVTDGGHGFEPPTEEPRPEEPGGWGLVVVDRLASRWGIDGGPGTRVWAELPLRAPGAAGGPPGSPVYASNV